MRLCVVRLAGEGVAVVREFAYAEWEAAYRARDEADGPVCALWPGVRHAVRWVA